MWQLYLFLAAIIAALVGLLLSLYEKLRPSRSLRLSGAVLLLAGTVAMLPVIVERALSRPALWIAVALLVGILVVSPLMLKDAWRR